MLLVFDHSKTNGKNNREHDYLQDLIFADGLGNIFGKNLYQMVLMGIFLIE